jgi:Nucleoside 2-deoxyribosyltransferase like
MNIIFAGQTLELRHPSIFLAGPTPRSSEVASWRPQAIDALHELEFDGIVLIPERQNLSIEYGYADQVEWEYAGLEACTVIAFWVPRQVQTLPGFTTNVEFGRYVGSGRCVYGRPDGASHTSYLDWLYKKITGREPQTTLRGTLTEAARLAAQDTTVPELAID